MALDVTNSSLLGSRHLNSAATSKVFVGRTGYKTIITDCVVTNIANTGSAYSVYIVPENSIADHPSALFYEKSITSNEAVVYNNLRWVVEANETVYCGATTNDALTFHFYGVQIPYR